MKLIGLFCALITTVITLVICGFYNFIDLPSILLVSIITPSLMVYKYGTPSLKLWSLDEETRIEVARWSGKLCLQVGAFGTLVGFIAMGFGLKSMNNFGPAFSVSLMTIFYSYIIYLFYFAPMAAKDKVLVKN